MLLLLMASSNVIVIIIGTSFAGKPPGIVVPSSEQKQSGKTQTVGSVEIELVKVVCVQHTIKRKALNKVIGWEVSADRHCCLEIEAHK